MQLRRRSRNSLRTTAIKLCSLLPVGRDLVVNAVIGAERLQRLAPQVLAIESRPSN
jgi:hypothetical protein